ncbi:hypothetical protein FY528_10570 [Hymenobacter lutimineralis]|uniref:Lipoprotein n=1 Tax=Hymenobacter lutimineralis TaxID=2606448 RepID=A0A5D6V1K0_9BACT|nr:hypothetical protein [Hymenobacter lutimineralis]TYZ09673.1 hypothetical protein FY528_10570 [Hymenobacter lutimineralis]
MKFRLFCLCALVLSACKSNDSSPTIDFGPYGGISMRDVNNSSMSTPDPTDWTLDGRWNAQERSLFHDLGIDLNATATGTVPYMSAYPNPATTQTTFHYGTPVAVTCSFVVVDEKYAVVAPRQDFTTPSCSLSTQLDISGSAFRQGQRYRLYYVFRNGSALYYKGHGDIQIGM